jgi:hypothetical protein
VNTKSLNPRLSYYSGISLCWDVDALVFLFLDNFCDLQTYFHHVSRLRVEIKMGIKNSMKNGYLGYSIKIGVLKIVNMYWEGVSTKGFLGGCFNI